MTHARFRQVVECLHKVIVKIDISYIAISYRPPCIRTSCSQFNDAVRVLALERFAGALCSPLLALLHWRRKVQCGAVHDIFAQSFIGDEKPCRSLIGIKVAPAHAHASEAISYSIWAHAGGLSARLCFVRHHFDPFTLNLNFHYTRAISQTLQAAHAACTCVR